MSEITPKYFENKVLRLADKVEISRHMLMGNRFNAASEKLKAAEILIRDAADLIGTKGRDYRLVPPHGSGP